MRDSRGCAGAVRVQSAVSAGAGAPCVRIPVMYAYSPPRAAKGGMACLPRWLARTLGWARRGRTADLATWTSAAFDSMPVLFSVAAQHVSVLSSVMQQSAATALQQQHQLKVQQQYQLADQRLQRPRRAL